MSVPGGRWRQACSAWQHRCGHGGARERLSGEGAWGISTACLTARRACEAALATTFTLAAAVPASEFRAAGLVGSRAAERARSNSSSTIRVVDFAMASCATTPVDDSCIFLPARRAGGVFSNAPTASRSAAASLSSVAGARCIMPTHTTTTRAAATTAASPTRRQLDLPCSCHQGQRV